MTAGRNVTHRVVGNDLCIGCGVCAGVCPVRSLEMSWSARGELVPVQGAECAEGCVKCLAVCPFGGGEINQDVVAAEAFGSKPGMKHRAETGFFSGCRVGYAGSEDHRARGASGGMATWFLETLLASGEVDFAVCVTEGGAADDRLFRFEALSDVEAVRAAARSKYYPVEMSGVIRAIREGEDDRRYAVIGLPCAIHGLNLAMRGSAVLRRRVKFTLSMACGQLPSRFYTEFLSIESGIPLASLGGVNYREKDPAADAGNFVFRAEGRDGRKGSPVHWAAAPWHLWRNGYFLHNACRFCDDVFGETADVVFMDAWLPEYSSDPRGHSIVLSRSAEAEAILAAGKREGACVLEELPIERAILSQAGQIAKKRHLIRGVVHRSRRLGRWVPERRVGASARIHLANALRIRLGERIMNESKLLWPGFRDEPDNESFLQAMARWERYVSLADRCDAAVSKGKKLLTDPVGVAGRAARRVLG